MYLIKKLKRQVCVLSVMPKYIFHGENRYVIYVYKYIHTHRHVCFQECCLIASLNRKSEVTLTLSMYIWKKAGYAGNWGDDTRRWTINNNITPRSTVLRSPITRKLFLDWWAQLLPDSWSQLQQEQVWFNHLLSVRGRGSSPLSTGAARPCSYSPKPRHRVEPPFSQLQIRNKLSSLVTCLPNNLLWLS